MAMAVAVKDTPQAASRHLNPLAVRSLAGTAYVLVSLAAVYAIPKVWDNTIARLLAGRQDAFVDQSLMGLTLLAATVGLIALGRKLAGTKPPLGLRAGIFVGALGAILIGLVTRAIGESLESAFGADSPWGLPLTIALGLGLLGAGASVYFRSGFENFLVHLQEQGWFSFTPYKKNQGQRVRRGTTLSVLVLAGCGIYTMLAHDTLKTGSRHWQVALPFSGGQTLTLLPDIQFTLPIIIAAAALWFAYRIVHFPVFADFLIATEAELNKVSWTTRKRLVQDTIVVLTTVFLFTLFLFLVDVAWYYILSSRYIQVIQTPEVSGQRQANPDEW
jgi:preprotein translocase SecE subunit